MLPNSGIQHVNTVHRPCEYCVDNLNPLMIQPDQSFVTRRYLHHLGVVKAACELDFEVGFKELHIGEHRFQVLEGEVHEAQLVVRITADFAKEVHICLKLWRIQTSAQGLQRKLPAPAAHPRRLIDR